MDGVCRRFPVEVSRTLIGDRARPHEMDPSVVIQKHEDERERPCASRVCVLQLTFPGRSTLFFPTPLTLPCNHFKTIVFAAMITALPTKSPARCGVSNMPNRGYG